MGQILLGLFAAYLLYNFVFRFLIPLIKVTRQVKRQVRDFQQQANAPDGRYQAGGTHSGGFQPGNTSGQFGDGSFRMEDLRNNAGSSSYGNNASTASTRHEASPKKDDYIDFEEIK